jgi:hypothetical protein
MDSIQVDDMQHDTLDMAVARMYDLEERLPTSVDHDYVDIPNKAVLSQYKQAVVTYIAGYVVRMVKQKVNCTECKLALTEDGKLATTVQKISVGKQFMLFKNHGGLTASTSVIMVCEETEKCFQRMYATLGDKLPQGSKILSAICIVVLKTVGQRSFPTLTEHMFATTPDNNHVFNLVKCLARCYSTIRSVASFGETENCRSVAIILAPKFESS